MSEGQDPGGSLFLWLAIAAIVAVAAIWITARIFRIPISL
jgi:hypothetical protein